METGTITRRMDSVLNGLDSKFKSMIDRTDFERKITVLKAAGNKSSRPSILASLFSMFNACGISYEKGKDNAYYEKIVKEANLPSFSEVEDKMMYELYMQYEKYPSPEDYMLRIVNRMSSEEDGWFKDTLRVRILKQFIEYGNYLADAGFGGRKIIQDYVKGKIGKKPTKEQIIKLIDDDVFEGLKTATKPQKKPEGKFGLLKLSDDLAGGKFRMGGATKKGLYLFAMVFGMTYYSGAPDEIKDYESDIEKNLFRDYYSNNLMRFISDSYKGKLCEFEADPSGQGINYKNFAEMIYIYYISKAYEPEKKIRLASEMIKRVQETEHGNEKKDDLAEEKGTLYYKKKVFRDSLQSEWFCEEILKKTEEDFEKFIRTNYNCNTLRPETEIEKSHSVGVMQLETEQNTAFKNYQKILDALKKIEVPLESCNYGLWFTDVAAFKKKGYQNLYDKIPGIDRDKFERFINLLEGVNNFLGNTVEEEVSRKSIGQEWTETSKMKTKALYVSDSKQVTRTSMIVAYYYYYNALYEDSSSEKGKCFEEVFNHFKKGIDVLLEDSSYQPLSGKNIFDVLIVFSSYAYLNI